MKLYIGLGIITFCQFAIFAGLWYYNLTTIQKASAMLININLFPIAKASAMLININLFFILMTSIKLWRRFIYISYFTLQSLHSYLAISFVSWSLIHLVAHYINFIKVNNLVELLDWGVGLTGNLIIILIILLIITSLSRKVQEINYSLYISLHYIIIIGIITLTIIHGTFYITEKETTSTTWIWLILPFMIILCETCYKYIFGIVSIKRVIYHNQNLLEIQLPLTENYCGKTIWINCPSINPFEWHPFTVTKRNAYHNTCSIHVKIRGDWTSKLASQLQNKNVRICIDGPYYCIEKDFTNTITKNPTLLVTSGIGMTNFSYPLKQLSQNTSLIQSKITMIVIVKSSKEIEWLLYTLLSLKDHIHFLFYFTEISDTSFPFEYQLGRPQFDNILDYLILQNCFTKANKIKVYYSGLQGVVKSVTQAQKQSDIFENHF